MNCLLYYLQLQFFSWQFKHFFLKSLMFLNFWMLFTGLVSWSGIAGCLMNWSHLASQTSFHIFHTQRVSILDVLGIHICDSFLFKKFSMLFIGLVSWSGIAGCLMNWLHLASSIKCVFCGEQVGKYHCVIWWWHVLSRIFKEKSFQKSPTYPPLCHALCSIA